MATAKNYVCSLKAVRRLVVAAIEGERRAECGNHSFFRRSDDTWLFRFFGNTVCTVPQNGFGKPKYDLCGYSGYSSTTRTIHSYKSIFGEGVTAA